MKIHPKMAIILALVVITVAIYAKVANFPFCEIDDRDYVSENSQVAAGLTVDSITWAFTSFHASNWHPLTWISLMADSQLFGTDPRGYHLVNVILHALSTVLLFVLFNVMTGTLWRSAFVAACFALHPLHVESVAWISERKDVLSALFWMITLICYGVYVQKSKRSMYVLSLLAFALGLMAKPMLVTIPVILLLLDFWPFGRFKMQSPMKMAQGDKPCDGSGVPFSNLLAEKVPYLALSLASSVITFYAQSHGGAVTSLAKHSIIMRVNNALWSAIDYVSKMVYPLDLAIFYPYAPIPAWKALCALFLISSVLYISVKHVHDYPWLVTGWLWYLVTLLPVIGLIQVGTQAMADRYTYIPYIGLFMMVSWGAGELWQRVPKLRKAISFSAGGLLLFFSVATWAQLGYWQDNASLLAHAIEVTKDNYFSSYALALAYERQGATQLAIEQFKNAIKSYPDNPEIDLLYFHLGSLLDNEGKSSEAVGYFEEVIKRKPQDWKAYYNMGLALGKLRKIDDALNSYHKAIELAPENAECYNNIGMLLAQQGHPDQAVGYFAKALQLNPGLETARLNLQLAQKKERQTPAPGKR